MPTYTKDELATNGAPIALAILLQHARDGDEPFVTYGCIAKILEVKLGIKKIFSTHIGGVAGKLMDDILSVDEKAPLINGMITQPTGIPGKGFGGYYNGLIRPAHGWKWDNLNDDKKIEIISEIRAEVRQYSRWNEIYKKLYGSSPEKITVQKKFTEVDGKTPETGFGGGESQDHKKLKEWVFTNPVALGLSKNFKAEKEHGLLSGDRIDVLFTNGEKFVAVEVKSWRSSVDDFKRGIYQCVKYRHVLEAQEFPVKADVRAILFTEKDLPNDLKIRAKELNIKHICKSA